MTLGQALGQALSLTLGQALSLTLGQALGLTLGQALGLTLGQARAKTLVQARARPGPTSFRTFQLRNGPGCDVTGKLGSETKFLAKSGLSDPISGHETAKTEKQKS